MHHLIRFFGHLVSQALAKNTPKTSPHAELLQVGPSFPVPFRKQPTTHLSPTLKSHPTIWSQNHGPTLRSPLNSSPPQQGLRTNSCGIQVTICSRLWLARQAHWPAETDQRHSKCLSLSFYPKFCHLAKNVLFLFALLPQKLSTWPC